jgi:magnesium chelatase subunit D
MFPISVDYHHNGVMGRFPFTAVVGQQTLKTALLLAIVDPAINGVLISGSRGSAKSTLVRGLQALLPDRALVTLPLGATEEMVAGSLQLQQALKDGEVVFAPGLLARAHGGLLYVDEVNLLPDHLVDLLLDVAASGENHVERDGISHRHEAEFVLVGTMNPDEGELRPQLLDRFGLMASVQQRFMPEERREIVRRRVDFDADPAAFESEYRHAEDELRAAIESAAARLDSVAVSETIGMEIAERCAAAGVDGLRADIVFYRAGRAHAALAGKAEVGSDDLDAVAELVLGHRRDPGGPDDSGTPSGSPQSGDGDRHSAPVTGSSAQGTQGRSQTRAVESGRPLALPARLFADAAAARTRIRYRERGESKTPGAYRGRRDGAGGRTREPGARPHWFRTLADADNIQRRLRGETGLGLHYRRPRRRSLPVNIVLLDTSASTRLFQALGKAKGAIRELARESYLERARFAVVTFGNDRVETVLSPQRAPHDIGPLLERIQAGGGTPLYRAIHYLDGLVGKLARKHADCRIFILTDGKVRGGAEHRSANLERARSMVVDIELGSFRLGRSRYVARALGADYLHISELE